MKKKSIKDFIIGYLIFAIIVVVIFSINNAYDTYWSIMHSKDCGIRFTGVVPNSPAEKAGLRPGIIIQKIDGKPIYNITDFANIIDTKSPGEVIEIVGVGYIGAKGVGENSTSFLLTLDKPPSPDYKYKVFMGIENVYTFQVVFLKGGNCVIE